jgi:hypothetical protein
MLLLLMSKQETDLLQKQLFDPLQLKVDAEGVYFELTYSGLAGTRPSQMQSHCSSV